MTTISSIWTPRLAGQASMAPTSMDDLPPEIHGPSAWYGPDLAARGDWIEQLTETEILEIDAAAERLANAEIDIPSIRQHDFPLPTLGPRLRGMLEDVLTGRGFVLLRRLPVDRWSMRKTAIAYFGLGTHLGRRDRRTRKGTCSATSRIWACRAPTRMCTSTRQANGKVITPTHAMSSGCSASSRRKRAGCQVWSVP